LLRDAKFNNDAGKSMDFSLKLCGKVIFDRLSSDALAMPETSSVA
jgi:hypothetical protein